MKSDLAPTSMQAWDLLDRFEAAVRTYWSKPTPENNHAAVAAKHAIHDAMRHAGFREPLDDERARLWVGGSA